MSSVAVQFPITSSISSSIRSSAVDIVRNNNASDDRFYGLGNGGRTFPLDRGTPERGTPDPEVAAANRRSPMPFTSMADIDKPEPVTGHLTVRTGQTRQRSLSYGADNNELSLTHRGRAMGGGVSPRSQIGRQGVDRMSKVVEEVMKQRIEVLFAAHNREIRQEDCSDIAKGLARVYEGNPRSVGEEPEALVVGSAPAGTWWPFSWTSS